MFRYKLYIFSIALLLMAVSPIYFDRATVEAQQAHLPPVLTGKLTWTYTSRFEGDHSSEEQNEQAVVHVRLRWDEALQSYEDDGSTYTYAGTYRSRQFNPDNIVGMVGEGSKQGDGRFDSAESSIGASVEADHGQPRRLLLSISGLLFHSTGTVTLYPGGEQQTISDDGTLNLLCDDPNWLIGREQQDQPGVFSLACSQTQGGQTGSAQTTVSGFLSVPTARPRIADLRFEHQNIENREWERIEGPPGTVDGNQVRVIATIENLAGVPYDLPLRFMDGETHQTLVNGDDTVSLPPGGIIEKTYLWDTDGWAWDGPTPSVALPHAHSNRAIEIRLGSDAVLYDVWNAPIIVRPKPVILVHGLNSNAGGWSSYPGFLKQANDYWVGYAVPGMRTGDDIVVQQASSTLFNNARAMHTYVEQIRRQENAWHIDIVAHSMGGLISRQYIHSFMPADTPDGRPLAKHLVMLGTPNRGSECATIQLYLALTYGLPNRIAPLELMPDAVAMFNNRVTDTKGTAFSVLAGNPLNTFICNPSENGPNDMVVTVSSAHSTYSDIGLTPRNHIQMTGSQADFVDWVLPHLAVGRATGLPGAQTAATPAAASDPIVPAIQFSQTVSQTISAGGSLEIPLVLPSAKGASVTLIAAPAIDGILLDSTGTQVAVINPTNSASHLRGLTLAHPVAGQYKLVLNNKGSQAASIFVAVSTAGTVLEADVQVSVPDTNGRVTFTAALRRDGTIVQGTTMSASIFQGNSASHDLIFVDDGKHGDGTAGDGIFGAVVQPSDTGTLAVVVHMQTGGEEKSVVIAAEGSTPTRIFLPVVIR